MPFTAARRTAPEYARVENLSWRLHADAGGELSHADIVSAMLAITADALVAFDRHGHLLAYNESYVEMWHVPTALTTTGTLDTILEHAGRHLVDGSGLLARRDELDARPELERTDTVWSRDGRCIERSVQPLRRGYEVLGHIYRFRDISHQSRLAAELERRTQLDTLTGLVNRSCFQQRVQLALQRALQPDTQVAVLALDLDDFRRVNDSYGHAEGDALLRLVAQRISRSTRGSDTVARLSGDEFAVLLEDAGHSAAVAARRIADAISRPMRIGGIDLVMTSSIGIARGDASRAADALVRNAEMAMHHSKDGRRGNGSDGIATFAPNLHARTMKRLHMESELRQAVERQEFVLYYQPIVRLANGGIVGAEALIRWNHPQRGMVPPSDFIPLAERFGLIVPLGKWVLGEACRQAVMWHRAGHDIGITVNVSGRQLREPGFVADVEGILGSTQIPPDRLTLELTEGLLMEQMETTLQTLRALKALGVRLAVDDFGTGYSSLRYLDRFPLDVLKIDKSFVDALGSGTASPAVAEVVIALGETLALTSIAEGIEEAEQVVRLRGLGCELGQGYHFARPMPAEAMTTRLRSGQSTYKPLSSPPVHERTSS